MKPINKIIKTLFVASFTFLVPFFSFSQELTVDFHEYTLENGLKVFVLEDFSSAPVRIELSVRAGFSAQTPKTAGFFPLYAQIFPSAGKTAYALTSEIDINDISEKDWLLSSSFSECNADSARFSVIVAPVQVEKTLEQFSDNLFSPVFSDSILTKEFSDLKTQVMQNAFSTAGFINSSIDSRIFAQAPWKQDSGIYPSIFTETPLEEARTILTSIGRNYYTPSNSALFISGGISGSEALELARKYFQKTALPSAGILSDSDEKIKSSEQKKFVLHDKMFTKEMSQIVIQYTSLSMQQTDIVAASLNEWNSSLKTTLVETPSLSIRGQEYINVASAHKNASSRVIFQSLLEKNKTSPVEQAETFLNIVKSASQSCDEAQILAAKEKLISQYRTQFKNSTAFMDLLSQFWAISNVAQVHTENISNELLAQPTIITNTDSKTLFDSYDSEEPFVFVLVNSDVYKQNSKSFAKAGYQEVTTKNGSWFTQKLYENLKNQINESPKESLEDDLDKDSSINMQTIAAERFAQENRNSFSSFRLSNDIPVVVKRNSKSATAVISLAISGGKLSTAQTNPGLSEIMTNALARNIQTEISNAIYQGFIVGDPEVLAETGLAGGIITVECLSEDVIASLDCISSAIISGIIKPAVADGFIYDRRSQHRIQVGSTEYQLYCNAIRLLYSKTEYPLIYSLKDEILENTTYTQILAAYPGLLDAAKYSLVLIGNVPETGVAEILEEKFGVLVQQTKVEQRLYKEFPSPDFSDFENDKTGRKVFQLNHQFFTDLTSPAGARPEILVPTTEFLDPVQYWLPSPSQNSADFFVFNALLYELEERLAFALENQIENAGAQVRISPATAEIQAAVITFINVLHTDKIDELYTEVVKNALDPTQNENIISEIKNAWILHSLANTQTNRGTALLVRSGLEQGAIENERNAELSAFMNDTDLVAAERYLSEYEQISKLEASDLLRVAQKYLPEVAPLRLYSKDSKR